MPNFPISETRWDRHYQKELTSGNGVSACLRVISIINNVRIENIPPNFFISSLFWRIANCLPSLCTLRYNMNSVAAWLKRFSQWLQLIFLYRKSYLFAINPARVSSLVFLWRHCLDLKMADITSFSSFCLLYFCAISEFLLKFTWNSILIQRWWFL